MAVTEQSASSVTVITATDIETQQLRTLPDALAAVPGLDVVQSGGPGSQTSVFMRGTNSDHVARCSEPIVRLATKPCQCSILYSLK
jgi:outer membrane cobalamin receptor